MMIDQENPSLDPAIQHSGCYFLSIIYSAGKRDWTADQINKFYRDLLNNGITDILSDCTVENPEEVFLLLGVRVKQLRNADGSINIPLSVVPPPGGFEILCYKWKAFTHFVVGDGNGKMIYDTIHRGGSGSNTVKYGRLDSKRIFALA